MEGAGVNMVGGGEGAWQEREPGGCHRAWGRGSRNTKNWKELTILKVNTA